MELTGNSTLSFRYKNSATIAGVVTRLPAPYKNGYVFTVETHIKGAVTLTGNHLVFLSDRAFSSVNTLRIGDYVSVEGPVATDGVIVALDFTNMSHTMRSAGMRRSLEEVFHCKNTLSLRGLATSADYAFENGLMVTLRTRDGKRPKIHITDHKVYVPAQMTRGIIAVNVDDCIECDGHLRGAILVAERFTNYSAAVRPTS